MSIEDGTYYIVAGDQPGNTDKQWGFYLEKNPMMHVTLPRQAGETDFQLFQITKGGPENNQYSIQSQGGDKLYLGYINGEIRKDHYDHYVASASKQPFWWDVTQEFERSGEPFLIIDLPGTSLHVRWDHQVPYTFLQDKNGGGSGRTGSSVFTVYDVSKFRVEDSQYHYIH